MKLSFITACLLIVPFTQGCVASEEEEELATEEAVPQELASEEAAPEELASDEAVPQKLASEEAVPQELASEEAVPQKLASEEAVPQKLTSKEQVQPQTQSFLGDACKNTDIFITNSRFRNGVGTAIEVRSVSFYNATEGQWTWEDLANTVLNFGETHVWWNEDLGDVENETISQWKVHYRFLSGGSWSSDVYQTINTPDETCIAGRNFEMTVP